MNTKVRTLAECAILAALSFVLSLIPGISMPMGGTISWFATVPVLFAAMRHGTTWGIGTALVYSITQLLLGVGNFNYLPKTFFSYAICALFDYILAYTVVGLAGSLYRLCKTRVRGIVFAVIVTGFLRLVCSFISGVVLYGEYAPPGMPIPLYSFLYNAGWCVPDFLIALFAVLLLSKVETLRLPLPKNSSQQ